MNLPPELTGLMWAIALGVVPAAAAVSALCALCIRRPATRHALWLVVLLLFITPLTAMLPGAPRLPDPINALAARKSVPATTETLPPPPASKPKADPVIASPRIVSAPAPALQQSLVASPGRHAPALRQSPAIQSPPLTGMVGLTSSDVAQLNAPERASTSIHRSPAPPGLLGQAAPAKSWSAKPELTPAPRKSAARAPATKSIRSPAPLPTKTADAPVSAPLPPDEPAATEPTEPLHAATSEFDRYIDRLVGARDAVAAVPPPPGELWLSGVLAILCIAVLRAAWRRRACHHVHPADTETRLLIAACSQRIGLRRAPEALFTPRRISPLVTCGARPRIILPVELWTRLDDRARQAVILHELAHLRRGDHWIRWIEQTVTLAYWWHPIIWWVRSRLRHEADLCCDAWVTSLLPSARRAYAEALISTRAFLSERTDPAPAPGLAMTSARAKRFARRLTMVMTDSARPRSSVLGIALALAVAAAGTFVVPTLACPTEKSKAAKAPKEAPRAEVIIVPSPEPAVALGVRAAPTPPAAPRAPRAPRAPKAPSAPSGFGASSPAEPGESTFEQYMKSGADSDALRQLERRLSRLEKGVAELVARGGVGQYSPAPLAGRAGSGLGWAPKAGEAGAIATTDDGNIKRIYVIPEGKLKDLTELMARSDVPILINKGRKAITVYANPGQHETFYQFLVLINPDGVKVISSEDDHSDAHEHEHDHTAPLAAKKQMSDAQRELARKRGDEVRAAVDARRAEMDQMRNQMRELAEKRRAIEREAREMERKSELMREQADRIREEAERARERRSENAEAAEIEQIVARLEAQAAELEAGADAAEGQFDSFEQQADSLEEAADQLECQIDQMVEQIEEMIESAHIDDDEVESDREV